MTIQNPDLSTRRPPRSWRSLVVEFNPLFLLSAVSMLWGVAMLGNTTRSRHRRDAGCR